jgi:hypothetical protein
MHLPGIGAKKNPATEDDPRRGSPIHEPEGKSVIAAPQQMVPASNPAYLTCTHS